jgi:hypothetical protein
MMLHQKNKVFRFYDVVFMVFSGTIQQLALKTAETIHGLLRNYSTISTQNSRDYSWSSQEPIPGRVGRVPEPHDRENQRDGIDRKESVAIF